MPQVALSAAQTPLVLAVDIGSSSVRALLYDARGDQLADCEEQIAYEQRTDRDGASESDPATILRLVIQCIDGALRRGAARADEIAAVGMSCFWHGLLGLDREGAPTTPVFMWSDKRARVAVPELAAQFPVREAIAATGCRIHSSYWPAKLRWLQTTRPDVVARTATWVSVTDYVARELTGALRTSLAMASGTGLLDAETLAWHAPMLDALGLTPEQLPTRTDRDEPLPPLTTTYRERWPQLADVPWFPAIGDGAAANVGAGCVGADRIALTIGTSGAMRVIVDDAQQTAGDLWVYRLDRDHRVIGGALSNGGNVTNWIADLVAQGDFGDLSRDAARIAPDGHGLTVLPFLAGERSPSWNDAAVGTITGLHLATTAAEIYRATLEATAYRFAAIHDDLRQIVTPDHAIQANGGAVLNSPLWMQILADVLGHPIDALDAEAEASARGAAICALEAIGAIPSIRPVERDVIHRYDPDPATLPTYTSGRERHHALESLVSSFEARR